MELADRRGHDPVMFGTCVGQSMFKPLLVPAAVCLLHAHGCTELVFDPQSWSLLPAAVCMVTALLFWVA
jgi:hypothetical protein